IIAKGLGALPHSAIVSMVVAAVCAVAIEVAKIATRGRFPLSAVALGVGAMIFFVMGQRNREPGTRGHEMWVAGMEPICAGLIAGSALVGIGNAIVNVLLSTPLIEGSSSSRATCSTARRRP